MSSLSPEPTQPELSGLTVILTGTTVSGGTTISGGVTISGLVGVSGGGLTVSGGMTVSGGVTISGLVVVSGFAAVSGLFAGSSGGMKFMSGVQAFSGALPTIPVAWDYSGAQWVAQNVHYSGGSHIDVNAAKTTATMGLSGLYSTAASSVPNLSGGVALSSAVAASIIVRNWSGNTPIFLGFSGGFPASGGGAGFVLYGGDGITVEAQNMNLIYVVAQTSGTLISHFAQMY